RERRTETDPPGSAGVWPAVPRRREPTRAPPHLPGQAGRLRSREEAPGWAARWRIGAFKPSRRGWPSPLPMGEGGGEGELPHITKWLSAMPTPRPRLGFALTLTLSHRERE